MKIEDMNEVDPRDYSKYLLELVCKELDYNRNRKISGIQKDLICGRIRFVIKKIDEIK